MEAQTETKKDEGFRLIVNMEYSIVKNIGRWIDIRFTDIKEWGAARETMEYIRACFPDKSQEMDGDIILTGRATPADER